MPPTPRLLRRATLVVLLATSLALITAYFREGVDGPLHGLQSSIDDTAAPATSVVRRVTQPFRDAGGWASDLADAKSDRDRLAAENRRLRQALSDRDLDQNDADQLRAMLDYRRSAAFRRLQQENGLEPLSGRVLSRSPELYGSRVLIDVGSSSGVAVNDPVLGGVKTRQMRLGASLVGRVTRVASNTSEVTLLSDPHMAVAAVVASPRRPQADGILQPSTGDRKLLNLGSVRTEATVHPGDLVVTSGYGDRSGPLHSIYPRGLPIGAVTKLGQNDTSVYKSVQVTPWVDLSAFTTVLVLVKGTQAGGTAAG